MGRRIAKRINGTIVEKYLWSGRIRLLAVFDGNDNLIMRFNYADERVPYSMEYLGQTYYLMYDQIGSLRAVVDSSGLIVKRIDYDSFGNIILDSDPSFRIPIGFAGGLYDADTGLVRFGVRDYDPAIGRWTAKDPIDFGGGDLNLYGYVLNDPVRFIDPFGFWGSEYGLVELGKHGPTSSEFMKERNIKPLAPVLMQTVPFTVGLIVTAYTENPKLGGLAYELTETVLGLLLDQPAGIPKVIVTPIINPPCAE